MPTLTYNVTLSQLPKMLKMIFEEVPEKYLKDITRKYASVVNSKMQTNSPSSLKSGRGHRGAPLRFSVKTKDETKDVKNPTYFITPTKMVSSSRGTYNLASILEDGSKGGQKIVPVNAKMLKFTGKSSAGRYVTTPIGIKKTQRSALIREARKIRASPKSNKAIFKFSVTRGDIPPQRFIRKTYNETNDGIHSFVADEFYKLYSKHIRVTTASNIPTL